MNQADQTLIDEITNPYGPNTVHITGAIFGTPEFGRMIQRCMCCGLKILDIDFREHMRRAKAAGKCGIDMLVATPQCKLVSGITRLNMRPDEINQHGDATTNACKRMGQRLCISLEEQIYVPPPLDTCENECSGE